SCKIALNGTFQCSSRRQCVPRVKMIDPASGRIERLEQRAYCGQCLIGLGAVWTACLGHVGTPATALPAKHGGAGLDEISSRVLADQILGNADYISRLAIFGAADDGDNARTDLLLGLIDKATQVLGRQ